MKTRSLVIIAAILLGGCKNNTDQADAFGNFEATEVMVSAETSGRIQQFTVVEGSEIDKDAEIALIDTTLSHLQKGEIEAAMKSVGTRINSINAQNDILNQQIENLNVNVNRIEKMLKDDAATQKQFDDLAGQVAVLQKQIAANNTQKASVAAELSVYESKKATLNEQIKRSSVKSPLKGTIIEKYSEAGEITAAGKPLVKIAELSVIKLKVYVSGAQLGSIKTGQQCTVRIDKGEKEFSSFTGTISYISGKAEFTPKIIQTKEERVTLVYAVNIDVLNDGTLKSGMPGEAIFSGVNN
ncbi:MAG: HlyD family efflux transporter periplasmic adaptor subunit [Bacteroidales bacterium]|nr:HlyD family efflux transporter periplasmic adaptor subunit [Bacteroidales bacterium]